MKAKLIRKVGSAVLATAIVANCSTVGNIFTTSAAAAKYEFEDGTIEGKCEVQDDSAASGGKMMFLETGNISVDVTIDKTDMYELKLCYSAPYGDKIQDLYINGVNQGQVSFSSCDEYREISAGAVKLNEGTNTITIKNSWGWTNFDYLTISTAELPALTASKTLADKNASDSTKRLMSYLVDTYGNNIISGQQEFYGTSRDDEFDYIYNLSGEYPAIRGFDFGESCPLFAWDAGTADRAIDWVNNKGGIATASWHINVPKTMSEYTLGSTMNFDQTTYSEVTDFVTANVMVEGTVEHDYFLLAVENLATSLKKMQAADVPLIFRPFHEAEGNGGVNGEGAWFWWSKEGAETYKELYIYLHNILTEEYGLHNLIWEFNSYTYENSYKWYPGTDYVDIVGYDKYNAKNWNTGVTTPNTSAITSVFYSLVDMYSGDGKMIAMAENDTIPTVENLTIEKAGWLYFCPWYGEHLMDANYNTAESVKSIYESDYVITLGELPDLKSYPMDGGSAVTTATTPSGSNTTTTTAVTTAPTITTTTEEPTFTVKKYTVDLSAADETSTLVMSFEGTPDAYTNGCFGYADCEDWISIEWETTLDSNGLGTYTIDLSTVPASATSGEIQIWWAASWDNVTKTNIIADNELTDYKITTAGELLYGDANCDGDVDMGDAVAILKYLADPVGCALTEQGKDNGDVYNRGDKIDSSDALAIQKLRAKQLSELPESYYKEK